MAAWLEQELGIHVAEVKVEGIYRYEIEQNIQVREEYKRLILN